ncbi:TPA: host cell division inhibitor Icd-like protein [Klebsiella pneumoniae]|nr:host cell division inhibitor Icd-like protein [Klebsiella pneumoniae]HDZ1376657.1 host cell division inhibitor Icd-like protein [Klebsiella pneumoniae]
MMMPVPQKAPFSGLLPFAVSRYSFTAVAKSAAGRGNPSNLKATPDAPCVFFCVFALVHLLLAQWFHGRCCYRVMVAQAGPTSVGPVSFRAGISTPVWATTSERGNSGGSVTCYLKEVAPMATTLTPSHPQFVFVFAAVRRADRQPRICMLRAVAGDEHAARLSLVRDYVLSFAGRLPVAEVHA